MVTIKGKSVHVLSSGARVKLLQQHGNIVFLSLLNSNNQVVSYMVCSNVTINGYALDYQASVYYNNYNAGYYAMRVAVKRGLGALLI